MAEWFKALVLKTSVRVTVPGVQIPLRPLSGVAIKFAASFFIRLRRSARFSLVTYREISRRQRGHPSKRGGAQKRQAKKTRLKNVGHRNTLNDCRRSLSFFRSLMGRVLPETQAGDLL